MRFDSDERITAWRDRGEFPAIHTPLFDLVCAEVSPEDGNMVDIGSSIGLLSRRLADAGFNVRALDASPTTLAAGKAAGIYEGIPVRRWTLTPQDRPEFVYWLKGHEIKIVVARRVVSELHTSGVNPAMFTEILTEAGVEHLFLEGRAPRSYTTHPLPTLEAELKWIKHGWRAAKFDGPHRVHLVADS